MAECPGVYIPAEMKDGLLARLRVPGGTLTSSQLRAIATIAHTRGNGQIDLTNRANLQIRGLAPSTWQQATEELITAGLATGDPTHDRIRNIAIDPLSGITREEMDCTPLAAALDQALSHWTRRSQLSPKFGFVIDGGGPSNIIALRHDIGWRAERGSTSAVEFSLHLAGHLTPITVKAKQLVPTTLDLLETYLELAGANGAQSEATDTAPLRLKHLMRENSKEVVIEVAMKRVAKNHQLKNKAGTKPETARLSPSRGMINQSDSDHAAQTLAAPTGRLQAHQLEGLAELVDQQGDGQLRLTPWQAIIITGILKNRIDQVWIKAEALGLLSQEAEQMLTILSCTGSEGCVHGGFETKMKALKIREQLSHMAVPAPVCLHLCACEKGCASRDKSAILLMQKRDEKSMHLYVNAAPSTQKVGKKVSEENYISEIKKLI